jgi:hypothetical protein
MFMHQVFLYIGATMKRIVLRNSFFTMGGTTIMGTLCRTITLISVRLRVANDAFQNLDYNHIKQHVLLL